MSKRRTLLDVVLAGAVAGQVGVTIGGIPGTKQIAIQAICTVAGGGTTAKAWLQTSIDNGVTWNDVANFAFTTSTGSKLHNIVNTPATPYTPGTAPTDATLADNTIKDGPLGDKVRIKYTTTGTYTGASSLKIDAVFKE